MKKAIFLSAFMLCFAFVSVNATTNVMKSNSSIEYSQKIDPFCLAIVKGDVETVKKMIDLGADINEKSIGMTPVMYAAKFNKTEILNLLISKGAKLKLKSDAGYTAVDYAELSNAFEAKQILESALNS